MRTMDRFLAPALLLAASVLPAAAQGVPQGGPGTGGLVHLEQQRLFAGAPDRRVLVIGAHPDDEDTDLITVLARGRGVETAYLSLTRGEGGQNLIGSELGPALGIVRTEELLAARRIDGGQQFFTRAYDFGFSKTAAETFEHWPRDTLVKDIVRIIRRFRPHVIVSVWSGTERDGHGHHQVSGIVALDAFRAAGDSTRFPELLVEERLRPWTPLKFYRRSAGVDDPPIHFDAGVIDPVTGHSLHQIAMRSRSQHRSQDMGRYEDVGPYATRVTLAEWAAGVPAVPDDSLFAGIPALPRSRPNQWSDALRFAELGLIVDAYVEDPEVTVGQAVPVTLVAWNTGSDTVAIGTSMMASVDWEFGGGNCPRAGQPLAPGELRRCTVVATVSRRSWIGQPYHLVESPDGALYRFSGSTDNRGLPYAPGLTAIFTIPDGEAGRYLAKRLEVTARSLDQGLGELRRPVTIVPRVLVEVTPALGLWEIGTRSRPFTVTLEQMAPDSLDAEVSISAPEGWRVSPPQRIRLGEQGERQQLDFTVTAPADPEPGEVTFLTRVVAGGDTMSIGARRIEYPHITPRMIFHMATTRMVVAPVATARRRVGYVRGAADMIPEALALAGMPVRVLTPADLDGAVLDSLDVVVVGPRAYEIDDALRRANRRLLRFAEAGGTLVIQYQQYQYLQGNFPPFPMTIGRPHGRVTDETAGVRVLAPGHPVMNFPNRITAADFDGWVQERGLYFAEQWDQRWQPILEMADPDERPQQGSLLVGRLGRGTVVYTGLAFFRQIPAAVPGAWRLLANLMALGPDAPGS